MKEQRDSVLEFFRCCQFHDKSREKPKVQHSTPPLTCVCTSLSFSDRLQKPVNSFADPLSKYLTIMELCVYMSVRKLQVLSLPGELQRASTKILLAWCAGIQNAGIVAIDVTLINFFYINQTCHIARILGFKGFDTKLIYNTHRVPRIQIAIDEITSWKYL